MKSITKPRRNYKKIVFIGIFVALIIVAASLFWYFKIHKENNSNENNKDATTSVKPEQVDTSSKPSGSSLPSKDGTGSDTTDPGSKDVETPATPPEKPNVERAGGSPTIKVVATFQQASLGYCELQLSKSGSQTLKYESNVVLSTTYYICSFSIARSELPSTGLWSATVIHHIGNASTSSDTKELN